MVGVFLLYNTHIIRFLVCLIPTGFLSCYLFCCCHVYSICSPSLTFNTLLLFLFQRLSIPTTNGPHSQNHIRRGRLRSDGQTTPSCSSSESSNVLPHSPPFHQKTKVDTKHSEHRQRKENYVKHLEQDVIDLREMIAKAETQSVLFKHENIAIKAALQNQNIPLPATSVSQAQVLQATVLEQEINMGNIENLQQDSSDGDFNPLEQDMAWIMNDSIVSTAFDPFLNDECLQISPANSLTQSTNDISMPSPDIFNLTSMNHTPSAQQQQQKQQSSSTSPQPATTEEDISIIAINFILAYVSSNLFLSPPLLLKCPLLSHRSPNRKQTRTPLPHTFLTPLHSALFTHLPRNRPRANGHHIPLRAPLLLLASKSSSTHAPRSFHAPSSRKP